MTYEAPENIAETVAKLMESHGGIEAPETPEGTQFLVVPQGRVLTDLTKILREHADYLAPAKRRGTAKMADLESLIGWANRFKGTTSVLYAEAPNGTDSPSITCIADYHGAGAHTVDGRDPTARHGLHRAVYQFPLSDKWKRWQKVSGQPMTGIEMGQFLEDNILDVIDPPMSLTLPGAAGAEASAADLRLIDIAQRLDGKFGNAMQLLGMAKSFTVNEVADYTVANNSTTGEATIQVKSEHMDGAGQPIRVPKLFLIAVPVFESGPAYRLPVRFQYRKSGQTVKFILTLHDPRAALDDAFAEAVAKAKAETGLQTFLGKPEA